ncbi:MAG: hypothetical protein DKM50_01780 [Candidatus Margulisiibacteriota bacterium]|nr:MAG: hypothetical protein A2X43_13365 [Candidatus Margulisbacteria bacterium GWD2_39_127]OGI04754.1 MAG: hypothetical protein A2X42_10630 [Candidatus Margulisbacteria bacterium GWF2_38_17]OGI05699.1 MAG: hypothetical protein A2X41_03215 [Candidatus Margulisbacteria bacterium GWE2_39_32]PZM83633.1 MAG: hypothetical protein DKM50_01780 [Candidatus Margulisiibacteriota bacterium]HAR62051.1 hypothetical protein [Candidatus Margulisiibacteriota bacterium]
MIKYLIIILITFAQATLNAEYLDPGALGTSASTIGNANIQGFAKTATTIFENPAGLYRIKSFSIEAFNTKLMKEVTHTNIAIAFNSIIGNVGLGYIDSRISNIFNTDLDVFDEIYTKSTFGYNSSILYFSHEVEQKGFVYGYSLKYYMMNMGSYSGHALNADFGILFNSFRDMEISLCAKNVLPGSPYRYSSDDYEVIPMQLIAGIKKHIFDIDILSQVQAKNTSNANLTKHFALNYTPGIMPFFSIFGGWKEYFILSNKHTGITWGVKLNISALELSYASEATEYYEEKNNNYFSLAINF